MKRFLVLDLVALPEKRGGTEQQELLRPAVAGYVVGQRRGNGWEISPPKLVGAPENLFRNIRHIFRRWGEVRIFAHEALKVATLGGLWAEFAAGTYIWPCRRINGAEAAAAGGKFEPAGALVLADPPVIISFADSNCAHYYELVDFSNYGVSPVEVLAIAGANGDDSAVDVFASTETLAELCKARLEAGGVIAKRYAHFAVNGFGGEVKSTIASQGWSYLKRRVPFLPKILKAAPANKSCERAALFSGRSQAFRIGENFGPAVHVDVNSLYLSVAQTERLPIEVVAEKRFSPTEQPAGRVDFSNKIACVYTQTDLPLVPVRRGEEVTFPTGKFWATLCGPELLLLERHAKIHRVAWWREYATEAWLSHWADRVLDKISNYKQLGQNFLAVLAKLAGNSTLGRFAAHGYGWQDVPHVPAGPAEWGTFYRTVEDGEPVLHRVVAGRVQRATPPGEREDGWPAVFAWIASAGRVKLWEIISPHFGGDLLCCDTDGAILLASPKVLAETLERHCGLKPGQLRKVQRYANVSIFGPKATLRDGAPVVAGLKTSATRINETVFSQTTGGGLVFPARPGEQPRVVRSVTEFAIKTRPHAGGHTADGFWRPPQLDEPLDEANWPQLA